MKYIKHIFEYNSSKHEEEIAEMIENLRDIFSSLEDDFDFIKIDVSHYIRYKKINVINNKELMLTPYDNRYKIPHDAFDLKEIVTVSISIIRDEDKKGNVYNKIVSSGLLSKFSRKLLECVLYSVDIIEYKTSDIFDFDPTNLKSIEDNILSFHHDIIGFSVPFIINENFKNEIS